MTTLLVQKSQTLSFSSDPSLGALPLPSSNGSAFTIHLDSSIGIPKNAVHATVEVVNARIWNTSPNISASYNNNKLAFITTTGGGNFEMTIPNGLYSLTDLQALITRELTNLGYPANLIELSADDAQNKVVISFPIGQCQLDFTQANSVREVLGFNSRLAPAGGPAAIGFNETADNVAAFNRINYYKIASDLVSRGIITNNVSDGTIAVIPITVKSGSQINYGPFNPVKTSANELIGHSKNIIVFRLLDQLGRAVDTLSEYWSCEIKFSWQERVVFS